VSRQKERLNNWRLEIDQRDGDQDKREEKQDERDKKQDECKKQQDERQKQLHQRITNQTKDMDKRGRNQDERDKELNELQKILEDKTQDLKNDREKLSDFHAQYFFYFFFTFLPFRSIIRFKLLCFNKVINSFWYCPYFIYWVIEMYLFFQ